ncbi:MAG TPA: dihydrofolate reductase family protein [Solirubrobacteraceae bacterium]|nr:dihydrofolate reductase family protein [Solirubrobacteraceae bacterium]
MSHAVALRRIFPDGAAVAPEQAIDRLGFAERASELRPYVVANFVATADGRATLGGRSGPIGDEIDRRLFHLLRSEVDAVLVGAGTLRVERYGRLVPDPALRERRVRNGLAAEPLACVVSGRLELPEDLPLFADPNSRVVIFTSSSEQLAVGPADVTIVHLEDFSLERVLRELRQRHGVRSLLCEGGPTLFGGLLDERLVDELFLSISPKLAGGGDAPTISAGHELANPCDLELVTAHEGAGALYLRYRLTG